MKNLFRFNGTDRQRAKGPRKEKITPENVADIPHQKRPRVNTGKGGKGYVTDEEGVSFVQAKLKKEEALADKAEHDAELRRVEIARQRGELVPVDKVRMQLEKEHQIWLNLLEEIRQTIAKRISRAGIPLEVQETINEMIANEITNTRAKRAGQIIDHQKKAG
jgi:hypothetical protein